MEKVLVFKESLLDFEAYPFKNGCNYEPECVQNLIDIIFNPLHNCRFIDREIAEKSPEYKQIIPYVFITTDNKVFVYARLKKSGEQRLHGKWSIGFGGHINPDDKYFYSSWKYVYNAALKRELNEELNAVAETGYKVEAIRNIRGLLYDDSNEVGKVHFGIVHQLKVLPDSKVEIKEKDKLEEVGWMTIQELKNNIDKFENWSQICIKYLV